MYIDIAARKFYDYSLQFRGYSKVTIKRYRQSINYYCKFANITTLDQVTDENVRSVFFHGRTERNWKPITFISFHKSLVVFFRWCVVQGYMQKNPAEDIELPRQEQRLPRSIRKEDALRLLECAYNYPRDTKFVRCRNHALLATVIFAGLRRSELLHLKYSDVDLEEMKIYVQQGKGSKDRNVPISYALAESLRRYINERKALNKTCPEFFTSVILNKGFGDIGLKRLMEKLRSATKIYFTLHRLRHTFATLMIQGGCDPYHLMNMLGHTDMRTTMLYLSATAEHLHLQMAKHPLNELVR